MDKRINMDIYIRSYTGKLEREMDL